MSGYLTRDAILAADDLTAEEVAVPEWGGTVMVRALDGQGRDEWEASTTVARGSQVVRDTANIRAKLAARCITGGDGQPLFTQQDVAALGAKSAAALDRVWDAATRLSGIGANDAAELEGKSPDPPGSGSPSS